MNGHDRTDAFLAEKPRLLRLAYRYLGRVADAEDAVQDAWLRWSAAEGVDNPAAWLSTVVTRLCLDRLKSAAAQRESYVGPWLPEPLVGAAEPPSDTALDISFAVMRSLEALSPEERAAFFLHDLFETPYDEIARTLGKTQAACRKLAERARAHMAGERRRYAPGQTDIDRFMTAFATAVAQGDEAPLREILAADVEFVSDGGGRKAAALNVLRGRNPIVRFLLSIARKTLAAGTVETRPAHINGSAGLLFFVNGALDQSFAFDLDAEGAIATFYAVRNPDKLTHLA